MRSCQPIVAASVTLTCPQLPPNLCPGSVAKSKHDGVIGGAISDDVLWAPSFG